VLTDAQPHPLDAQRPAPAGRLRSMTGEAWLGAPSRRVVDVVLSACGMVALGVPLLLIGGLVRLTSPGPAVFGARRIGKSGREFRMYKFRSMVVGSDQHGPLVTAAGDPRVTRLGRWLRRTKVDELPALWNVLSGEMSLVGPRPEDPRLVDRYTQQQRRILAVRPGLTGLATVTYPHEEDLLKGGAGLDARYFALMQDKLRLDLAYLDSASPQLDLRILVRTLAVLLPVGGGHA
jgi:lipopolysaccharide/colanic/teichoic acid biosynthesis glycosyltransferase